MFKMLYRTISIAVFFFASCLVLTYLQHTSINMKAIYDQGIASDYEDISEAFKIEAHKKPDDGVRCTTPPLTNLSDFFNFGKTNGKTSCTHMAEMGGKYREKKSVYPYNAGARIVCLDDIKKGDCNVVTFESTAADTTFDDDMNGIVGCKLHIFDPEVEIIKVKNLENINIYKMGLSTKKGNIKVKNRVVGVDTYEAIINMINLEDSIIDYLKMDIEGQELEFLKDPLTTSPHILDNVRQLSVEIHPILIKKSRENMTIFEAFQPYWEAMHQLECLGFDLISFVPNLFPICKFQYEGKEVSGCYDFVYLRRPRH